MHSTKPSLKHQLRVENNKLDRFLRRNVGICLKTYRLIKATTQLAGVAAGIYSLSLGGDPMTTFALISVIIVGPEAVETVITNTE